jgi:sortase (surface protein transpeptidase)
MIRNRFSPIVGVTTIEADLKPGRPQGSPLPYPRSAPSSPGRVGAGQPRPGDDAGSPALEKRIQFALIGAHPGLNVTTRGALLIVVLALAFALNACSQPPPSEAKDVSSSITYHAARGAPQASAATKNLPVRLSIPVIGVDAPIETVGVTTSGDLSVPTQDPWEDVGWYSSGTLPGELGSAVIDGHLDRPGGYPAVFWRLRNLHVGNEVMVIDRQGKTRRFRVTAIEYYPPQYAPIQQIFENQSGRYLNLITCAGDWIPSQHQTSLRLVVYTTLE